MARMRSRKALEPPLRKLANPVAIMMPVIQLGSRSKEEAERQGYRLSHLQIWANRSWSSWNLSEAGKKVAPRLYMR